MKDIAIKIMPIVTNKGMVDNGLETPIRGYNSLANNPMNIDIATLKPTENKIVFTLFFKSNFRILSIRNPGMNEMQTNPIICLAIGMSKYTVTNIADRVASINSREFLTHYHAQRNMHNQLVSCS